MKRESDGRADEVFEMTEHRRGDAVVVAIAGELDLDTVEPVERRLTELRDAAQPVVLDLDELTFMDSTGIRLLLTACEAAQRDGWGFAVTHGSEQVRRLLVAAGVAERLPYADAEQA